MSTCMMFVFGALIEYAFINALSRQDQKRTNFDDNDNEAEEEEGAEVRVEVRDNR